LRSHVGRPRRWRRQTHGDRDRGGAGQRGHSDPQPTASWRRRVVGGGQADSPQRVLLEPRRHRRREGEETQRTIERCVRHLLAPAAFATLDVPFEPSNPTGRQLAGQVPRDPLSCRLTSHD
jgi:hypothetical protein